MKLPDWLKLIRGDMEKDDSEEVTMLLHEPIGYDSWTGEGISSKQFGMALNAIPRSKNVALEINCLGGQVSDGLAMANMVQARGNVTTRVVGYAASMGAIIFQGGVKREMMPGTMMVIHNPHGTIEDGDQHEMASQAEMLAAVKNSLVGVLASRSGQKPKKISDMMDAVTAMDPETAKELGFCDSIIQGVPALNSMQFTNGYRRILQENKAPIVKNNIMKLLIGTLAKFKLVSSPDITDDAQASNLVETSVAALILQRDEAQAEVLRHNEALKTRVTNRITKAIEGKLIKPERKDSLIAAGITNEAALDFLDDISITPPAAPATPRRGAAPAPASPGDVITIDSVRNNIGANKADTTTDWLEKGRINANLAREARKLRGHENLFVLPAPAAR